MDTVSVSVPGVGEVWVKLAEGGGPVTPASRVTAEAIGLSSGLLSGVGLDWGAGTGLLAIAAALLPDVRSVVAIEHNEAAVAVSRDNVRRNGLDEKVTVIQADLYEPLQEEDRAVLDSIVGEVDFLVTNPPASATGDGLDWRRRVLEGARRFLRVDAPALVQVSAQYGQERIERIAEDVAGYRYASPVVTSEWVPFDLSRTDLQEALATYARQEREGGLPYRFRLPAGSLASASDVIESGSQPLTQWQVHRFDRVAE